MTTTTNDVTPFKIKQYSDAEAAELERNFNADRELQQQLAAARANRTRPEHRR